MTYFSFPGGWGTYNLNGLAEKELALTGAHGYATRAEAEAHVNASPSPDQMALLQLDKASSLSPVGAGAAGIQSTPSGTGGVSGLAGNLAKSFTVAGGPFAQNFWIRAAEFVLGIGLIIVGLAHISPGGTAAKIAKAAALA